METPKARPRSLVPPQKQSPGTPRTSQKLKTPGSDSSPKVVDRCSPRNLSTEKKKPARINSQLETQIAKLQEELQKSKEQLTSSETLKRRAQHEAEEATKQLIAASEKLFETEKQLRDICESEEDRVQELRKLSYERDKAWQSELKAVQKQHSMDSAALISAMNEIQKLKIQLERVSESEASHSSHVESAYAEIQSLRFELSETLMLVEKLKEQLNNSRESEAKAVEEFSRAQMELQVLKTTEEELRLESARNKEMCDSLQYELEQSKNRITSLDELVNNLKSELNNSDKSIDVNISTDGGQCAESELLKTELENLKNEANQLRAALEAAEMSYRDEYIQSTLEIRNAYELVVHAKSESAKRESELEAKLKESRAEVEELSKKLIQKENASLNSSHENDVDIESVDKSPPLGERERELELKLQKSESLLEELKASLLEKEAQLQSIKEENLVFKSEISNKEMEQRKEHDEICTLTGAAKSSEQDILMKIDHLTEEADKSSKKAACSSKELDAAQAANSELEAELRRLKVQSDQWRKAAEAAAAMLCDGNNNESCLERSVSSDYRTISVKLIGSPNSDDMDGDSSPKKKNGNVLRKIGGLLKKGQQK